jgi:hypothetical protein
VWEGGERSEAKPKRARKRNDREKKLELPNYRRQQPMPTSELEERASGRACQQPPSRASVPTTSFSRASVPTTSFSRASFARAACQKTSSSRASVPTTSFSRARFARAACERANDLLLSCSLHSRGVPTTSSSCAPFARSACQQPSTLELASLAPSFMLAPLTLLNSIPASPRAASATTRREGATSPASLAWRRAAASTSGSSTPA